MSKSSPMIVGQKGTEIPKQEKMAVSKPLLIDLISQVEAYLKKKRDCRKLLITLN